MQKKIGKHKSNSKKIGFYIPIIFIIAIVPLITYGKIVKLSANEADFWRGGTINVDFFYYYKSLAIILGSVVALIAYGELFLNRSIALQKEKKYYIPILIYSVSVILSSIMSKYSFVAIKGFMGMYQGLFVLISYMILLFVLINYDNNDFDIKVIVYSLIFLVIAEGLLGLGQYFDLDFFKTSLGKLLITPNELKGTELQFTFGKQTIYGTMYNTNYVGSFGALVLPLMTVLYLCENNIKQSILFCFVAMLAFSTWLGSNSRAGYLGIIVASLFGVIVFRKVIKERYKKVLILLFCFLIIITIFNQVSDGKILNEFVKLNTSNEAKRIENEQENQSIKFEDIFIKDNSLVVKTDKESLILLVKDSNIYFTNELGQKLEFINEDGNIRLLSERYSNYSFNVSKELQLIKAEIYGRPIDLYFKENQIKVISLNNRLTDPIKAPRIKFFEGKESFASYRGYIWSRSIPLLKDTILVGYGPDNFPMVFPHEDYVGRFNVGISGLANILIDKPHNIYIQTAINTGVVSLFALLIIWVVYIVDCLKCYFNSKLTTFREYIGAATFLSIIAYLVSGLFNDSVVAVAPIFWILLGMGIGINRNIKCQKS